MPQRTFTYPKREFGMLSLSCSPMPILNEKLCEEWMLKINLALRNVWFTEQFWQCFIELCHGLVFKGQWGHSICFAAGTFLCFPSAGNAGRAEFWNCYPRAVTHSIYDSLTIIIPPTEGFREVRRYLSAWCRQVHAHSSAFWLNQADHLYCCRGREEDPVPSFCCPGISGHPSSL